MDTRTQLLLTVAMVAALLAGATCLGFMSRAERDMRKTGGPGIVPFELVESAEEANRHLRSWGAPGQEAARRSISWDFGFIAAYVVLLGTAAVHVAVRADAVRHGWIVTIEVAAVILITLAGILDCVENVLMLAQLRRGDADPRKVHVTRLCARAKFTGAGLVAIIVLVGFGIIELSGQPTSGLTTAAMVVAAVLAALTLFFASGRRLKFRKPPAETI
jgi:hypothetical protein